MSAHGWLGIKVYHKRGRKRKKSAGVSKHRFEKRRLEQTAKRLRKNPPKSEVWFMSLYKDIMDAYDRPNEVYHRWIPDIINKKYKYIIEIDGSYHDLPEQKRKDLIKTTFFFRQGFTVIRIKAYDRDSFDKGIKIVLECRHVGTGIR